MNSKTAKLIAKTARNAAFVMVLKHGQYHPNKHMGDFREGCGKVCEGSLRNMKAAWKRTPWHLRNKQRRAMKDLVMRTEHALWRGRA